MKKIVLLTTTVFIYSCLNSQPVTFSYTGTIQTYVVPACVTSVTITAAGGSGGCNITYHGGLGASVTATVSVVPGHTLDVAVGGSVSTYALVSTTCSGDGGGGGSYVWDAASTNYPLVVAGGGGGAGGWGQPGNAASITTVPNNTPNTGAAGAGGVASSLAVGTAIGGSGAGWNTAVGVAALNTAHIGQGGLGKPGNFAPGAGSQGCIGPPIGAFGGGGGGGQEGVSSDYGGGGGGGGYNGGGGGNGVVGTPSSCYSGGGGSSGYYNAGFPYTNPVNFVNPLIASQSNGGVGSVKITPNCILPVQLLSFDAQYEKATASVNLTWSTALEVNNKVFTIEKSTDGETWVNVTTVPGSGNSNNTLYYKATDESPNSGASYYRLKQTDYDGNETYSPVRPIDITLELSITAYPNPTKGDIAVRYSTQSTDPINISIMDISGRTLNSYTINVVEQGVNNFQINTSSLSKGMYIMKVSNPQKTSYIKFEKE